MYKNCYRRTDEKRFNSDQRKQKCERLQRKNVIGAGFKRSRRLAGTQLGRHSGTEKA